MSAKTANKTKKPTMADKADIHELYEESVQNVANEVEFLSKTFRAVTGRTGYLFREDFCGTASLACEWAKQGPEFSAIGVDIDPSVLDWGRKSRDAKSRSPGRVQFQLLDL
jgi:hypothetical protein